jgi:hypothetical protein
LRLLKLAIIFIVRNEYSELVFGNMLVWYPNNNSNSFLKFGTSNGYKTWNVGLMTVVLFKYY